MKKFLISAIFYSLLNSTFAQDLDDFEVSEERRIGTILSKSSPFGYYSISLKDRVNENESKYSIKVFDLDNQEVSSVSFTEENGINISEVVFNGENILFKIRKKSFTKNKCIFYKLGLDHKFEKIIDYQTEENFKNSDGLYGGIESLRGKFFDISGGFINYYMAADEKRLFQLDYYDIDKKVKWKYKVDPNDNKFGITNFLFEGETEIISLVSEYDYTPFDNPSYLPYEGMHDRKIFQKIMINAKKNGHLIGYIPMSEKDYAYKIYKVWQNSEQNFEAVGLYYSYEGGICNKAPEGFIKVTFDKNGEIINRKYNNVHNLLNRSIQSSIYKDKEELGQLFYHSALPLKNGKVIYVAENLINFKDLKGRVKDLSIFDLGTIAKDIILIEVDSSYNSAFIKIIEKTGNSLKKPGVINYTSTKYKLANYYKHTRQYDYITSMVGEDKMSFQIIYKNKFKTGLKTERFISSIAFKKDKYFTDEIWLEDDKERVSMVAFKFGSVSLLKVNKSSNIGEVVRKDYNY